jgi:mono/diheme cytochrome c family protein
VRALHVASTATVAGIIIFFFAQALPTGFYTTPAGYTAQSIARGADLFAVYCAVCHGMEGRGNGLASKDLKIKPANLTSRHTTMHSDGDLFLWITNGVGELMPGFGVDLDEGARWSLVDFIRANADAARIRGLVTSEAFPAPDFSAGCPNGSTVSLDDLRGRIIHLVLAGPQFAEGRHQLAKLDLGSDVMTIVVPLDAPTTANATVCVADDPDVIKAFALYRGRDPGQMERTDFLVDAAGSLHSIWYPGINWNDADMLKRRIEEIRRTSASPRSRESLQ